MLVTKNEYGSTVKHLEAKHISSVPMPLAPEPVQRAVHEKIVRAYELRDRANDLLDEAEAFLYETAGITPFTQQDIEYLGEDKSLKAFTVSSADLGGRLDAGNHVPIVRSAIHKLEHGRHPLVPLGQVCAKVFIPPRFKRIYVEKEHGVPYLMPSQLPLMRPYGLKALSVGQAKANREYLLRKGELLLTTDGTVGNVHLVTERMTGWFGSNNLARLWDEQTDMGFMYAFLASPFGRHQVCKDIYGGVVDHISEKHIRSVLVPDVPREGQSAIGDQVFQAFEAKDEANALEDQAVTDIEKLIERQSSPAVRPSEVPMVPGLFDTDLT
jgi:type I restriction enzyme S subunit